MWKIIQFSIIVSALFAFQVKASSDIGIQAATNEFRVMVTFSNLDDSKNLDYFRRSSGYLFDLLLIIQENSGQVSSNSGSYWFEISNGGNMISIFKEDSDKTYQIVDIVKRRGIFKFDFISNVLCSYIGLKSCNKAVTKKEFIALQLKKSECETGKLTTGIWFGAFPSDYSKTPFLILQTPNQNIQQSDTVIFDRGTFIKTFGVLE